MHYLGVTKSEIILPRLHPIWPVRSKMMFGTVSEYYTNIAHEKSCKTCAVVRMQYLGVLNFQKTFCHECFQSNLLDPEWCLEVFRCITQTFDMKSHAKLVFWGGMHYHGVPNIWKHFFTNASNLTCWTQSDVWKCFGAVRKPSTWKIMQNLFFTVECIISGYRTSENILPW